MRDARRESAPRRTARTLPCKMHTTHDALRPLGHVREEGYLGRAPPSLLRARKSPSLSVLVVVHRRTQYFARTEDLDLHFGERTTHQVGDLVIGETMIEPQKEHRATLLR